MLIDTSCKWLQTCPKWYGHLNINRDLARMGAYWGYNFHRSCYNGPLKCGIWVLTREWAFAWDTTVAENRLLMVNYFYLLRLQVFLIQESRHIPPAPLPVWVWPVGVARGSVLPLRRMKTEMMMLSWREVEGRGRGEGELWSLKEGRDTSTVYSNNSSR